MTKKTTNTLIFVQLFAIFISMTCMYHLFSSIVTGISSYGDTLQFQKSLNNLEFRRGILFLMFPALLLVMPIMGYLSDKCGKLNLIISCHVILSLAILMGYCGLVLQNTALMLLALILFCVSQSGTPITLSILAIVELNKFKNINNTLLITFFSWNFFAEGIVQIYRALYHATQIKSGYIFIIGFLIEMLILIALISKDNIRKMLIEASDNEWKPIGYCMYQLCISKSIGALLLVLFIFLVINSSYDQAFDHYLTSTFQVTKDTLTKAQFIFTFTKIVSLAVLLKYFIKKYELVNLLKIMMPVSLGLILMNFTINNQYFELIIGIASTSTITITSTLLWLLIIKNARAHPMGLVIGSLTSIWIMTHMLGNFLDTLLFNKHINWFFVLPSLSIILIGYLYKYSLRHSLQTLEKQ